MLPELISNPRGLGLPAAMLLAVALHGVALPQGGGNRPGGESFGNNLSFPVIWAEGQSKVLRGEFGSLNLGGVWWYWWGIDPVSETPLSCAPDPDDITRCDDGLPGQATGSIPGVGFPDLYKVYLQKDALSDWQASSESAAGEVWVDLIDWGDNLESVDWTLRSQVRTEVVLIEDFTNAPDGGWETVNPLLQYGMRHTSGWGIDEVHGLASLLSGGSEIIEEFIPAPQATVYSHCARFMVQKLNVDRDDPALEALDYMGPEDGWQGDILGQPLANPPIFNGAVYEGGDGPGYYSAEINVKGKIIYGFTWNVRKLNEGAGCYRLTFALDDQAGSILCNTFFKEGVTKILEVVEGEEPGEESSEGGGGTGVIVGEHNLTYMDIRIVSKTGGGNSGGGGRR